MFHGCYRCGGIDHVRANCPQRDKVPAAPAQSAAAGSGYPAVPPRRPPEEVADAEVWAERIREDMGWATGSREDQLRELARHQVAISRASGPPGFETAPRAGREPEEAEQ